MRVLAWPGPRYVQQPYITQLYTHLTELGAEVTNFSAFAPAKKSFDVWHMHWPENRLIDPNPVWAGAQATRLLSEMHAARLRGTKIVWTAHNLKQHEGRHPHLEPHFWRQFTRLLDGWIALSPAGRELAEARFPQLKKVPSFIVPLGHYRGHYQDTIMPTSARRALGLSPSARVISFAGHIRAYKNVPHLVRTFRQLPDEDLALLIVGRAKDAWLRDELYGAAGGDPRVKLVLEFVPDDDLQLYLRASNLMALPYKDILNSSSAMLALSFDVPALVPARGAMSDLQRYAGHEWVKTFPGDLSAETLRDALEWAAKPRPALTLSELNWDAIAVKTLNAYEAVCGRKSATTRVTPPAPVQQRPRLASTLPPRRPALPHIAKRKQPSLPER